MRKMALVVPGLVLFGFANGRTRLGAGRYRSGRLHPHRICRRSLGKPLDALPRAGADRGGPYLDAWPSTLAVIGGAGDFSGATDHMELATVEDGIELT